MDSQTLMLAKMKYLIISFIIVLCCQKQSFAIELDSNDYYISVLKIEHFNDDAVKDTLIGTAGADRRFKLKAIIWGKDTASAWRIPDSLTVSETEFIYPEWKDFRTTLNIHTFNRDSIFDLVMISWGEVPYDDTLYKDTAGALIIFGQRGLDSVATIYIEEIEAFQYQPFLAMNLRYAKEYEGKRIRDLSMTPSYIIPKFDVETTDTVRREADREPEDSPPRLTPIVKIYPNPTAYYTNVEVNQIEKGDYKVDILSLQGQIIQEQTVHVSSALGLTKKLNLQDVPSGYYRLRIYSDIHIIGSYQLIVIH